MGGLTCDWWLVIQYYIFFPFDFKRPMLPNIRQTLIQDPLAIGTSPGLSNDSDHIINPEIQEMFQSLIF